MECSIYAIPSGIELILIAVVTAVASYFLGCFNGAVIVSKYVLRDDVRGHGSGNAGLTNFYRTFGGGLTFVVILCDVLKAVIAVLLGSWLFGGFFLVGKYWAALFCLLGHMFPCMFHFKGGKGILSGGTIAIMIDWRVALVVWGGFLLLTILTRYVSLGSLWAGASFPFATWVLYPDPVIVVLGFLCGGLVVWQHRANIKRLLSGTENKFSLHHKKEDGS
ncbi:glycerol-3-phosphate 1-O-acyltransferase PlsY [Oscillibacter sp. 1-3]|uniref:glycerol-3-phosphate 1-O-acyltransferase PlsY n=1 Tax=Oscillibacter sp. 1-3 TaxID=1235797 RepID=UPI00033C7CFF|nr:glycerol-3-phosphate 1-O-acyltransferase PlsY [Oscillibacter sp. 1-3]EOS63538.1 acyl-phosphate glycerol 3-phosphate acyltransferase [Oscillibacter sp. 1-3]